MNMRGLSGVAIIAAIVLAPCLGGSSEDKISENAKAFQAEIETMTGQPPQKVLDKLLSWKFELMGAWKTEDPDTPDFKKFNKGKTRFTKKEIAELLVPGPTYKIAFYGFLVGTEAATTGAIDELGRGVDKDASYTVRIFTVIRIVFRDDKLIQVRAWPKVESSQVTGGTWRDR
jgi:hypothetical protein